MVLVGCSVLQVPHLKRRGGCEVKYGGEVTFINQGAYGFGQGCVPASNFVYDVHRSVGVRVDCDKYHGGAGVGVYPELSRAVSTSSARAAIQSGRWLVFIGVFVLLVVEVSVLDYYRVFALLGGLSGHYLDGVQYVRGEGLAG